VFERGGEVDELANARAVPGQTNLSRDAHV
jgi:hypothetical protein